MNYRVAGTRDDQNHAILACGKHPISLCAAENAGAIRARTDVRKRLRAATQPARTALPRPRFPARRCTPDQTWNGGPPPEPPLEQPHRFILATAAMPLS